jgi:cell division protein FtsB
MKINSKYKDQGLAYARQLQDVRFAGQVLFVMLVLLISWSGVKTIQTNYGLQKQISELKQKNAVSKLQNTNMSLENQYYNTDQYLELSARQNFGLAAPGEKEMIVPKQAALTYTSNMPQLPSGEAVAAKTPVYERHVQAWVNFFLHRPSKN